MNANQLEDRLIEFAVRCTYVCRELHKLGYFDAKHAAGQLLRASTHPAFHYGEARSAESDKDFAHKLKVLLKELRETCSELKYCIRMNYFSDDRLIPLLKEANELVAIFHATVRKLDAKAKKY